MERTNDSVNMKGEYKTKRILMAIALKPGLTLDDQPDNDFRYLKNELKKIKFEPPSIFNQLKKLFIYLALLFVQEKPGNKKDIADKKELVSSLKNLLSIEQSKFNTYLSEVDKLKLMTLDFVNRRKSERDKSLMKLRGKKVNSEKNETAELQSAEALTGAKEMMDMLNAITAANAVEHETKLQKSYTLLNMQPWVDGESKEDFQSRLTDSTIDTRMNVKTIADADSFKTNDVLADIDDAYKYLRNFASPSFINPVPNSRVDKEETENNTSSIHSLKHR